MIERQGIEPPEGQLRTLIPIRMSYGDALSSELAMHAYSIIDLLMTFTAFYSAELSRKGLENLAKGDILMYRLLSA